MPHDRAETDSLPSKTNCSWKGKILSCSIDDARFFKEKFPYRSREDKQHQSGTPRQLNGH